jgi:hypothetical protein
MFENITSSDICLLANNTTISGRCPEPILDSIAEVLPSLFVVILGVGILIYLITSKYEEI